jgi:hypothetical protein
MVMMAADALARAINVPGYKFNFKGVIGIIEE